MDKVRPLTGALMRAMDAESLKREAATVAVAEVHSGMRVGLGTGSTARHVVDLIGARVSSGQLSGLVCVATSKATETQARGLGLDVIDLPGQPLDVAIDGADEVAPNLDMIKGLGGALLMEKRVERAAAKRVYVVDESKLVPKLGARAPLPVEVPQTHWVAEAAWLGSLGASAELRGGDSPFVSDNGNYILDARFKGGIDDPEALARALDSRPNVRAHGLFLGMADQVIVAGASGVRTLTKGESSVAVESQSPHGRNPGLAPRAVQGAPRASTPVGPHSVRIRPVDVQDESMGASSPDRQRSDASEVLQRRK